MLGRPRRLSVNLGSASASDGILVSKYQYKSSERERILNRYPRTVHFGLGGMDCCDILCGVMTCCSLCTLCEPSICNCCSTKKSNLDDPTPQDDPEIVQDQPHHTHAMVVRGKFADDEQDARITQYQGAKPKPW